MAQLAVAAAGAVVGGLIGGPMGASIGWSLGAVAGGALFGPKTNTEGPRLAEIRFTQSSYGATLPIVLGGFRTGAHVIWMGPVAERANRQRVGKNAYSTQYTYLQSFAVALCEGPVQGIRRVWFDNRLVYSAAYGDVLDADAAGTLQEQMTRYLGGESQAPDPTIEAVEGAGNVPAYRGTCYLVFTDLDLTPWGNRIPAITAEVIEAGTYAAPTLVSTLGLGGDNVSAERVNGGTELHITAWGTGSASAASLYTTTWKDVDTGNQVNSIEAGAGANVSTYGNGHMKAVGVAAQFGTTNIATSQPYAYPCLNDTRIGYQEWSDNVQSPDVDFTPRGGWMLRPNDDANSGATLIEFTSRYWCYDCSVRHGDRLYFIGRSTSNTGVYLRCVQLSDEQFYIDGYNGDEPYGRFSMPRALLWEVDIGSYGSVGGGGAAWVAVDEVSGEVYAQWSALTIGGDIALIRFSPDGEPLTYYAIGGGRFAVWNGMVAYVSAFNDGSYTITQATANLDGGSWPAESTVTVIGSESTDNDGFYPALPHLVPLGNGVFLSQSHEWAMPEQLTATGRTLAQCVQAITDRAGVDSAERDTSGITGTTVPGFLIERRMAARSALEPLLAAFGADGAETGGVLRFVPRGSAVVDTIEHSHLGAHASGEMADDLVNIESTREYDAVLPQQVDVVYAASESDYQSGTITAARGQVLSEQKLTIELPAAMTAAQAAQAAHRLLYDAWAGRTRRQFATDLRYAALEPLDVVSLEEADGTLSRVRIMGRTEEDGLIRWEALADDDGTPVQYADGIAPFAAQEVVRTRPHTYATVFEVPPLADADANVATLYAVGAASSSINWPGAVVTRSTVSDSDPAAVDDLAELTLAGVAQSTLPDWTPAKLPHDQSTVTASILGGTPPAVSVADQLTGSGLMLVGEELLRYQTATLVSGNTYRFGGLIRGVLGTDYAATDHGIASEPVVLLADTTDDALARVVRNVADIGTAHRWRAVSGGKSVLDAPSVVHTFTARNLKPIAPVHVHMVRQSNGDRTIRWTRRNRAYQAWRDYVDVPLSEASESYGIEILNADTGATLRTGTATTNSYTYTAAMIDADWPVTFPVSLRVRVWQVSSLVGAGAVADVTLTYAGSYNNSYANTFTGANGSAPSGFTSYAVNGSIDIQSNRMRLNLNSGSSDVKARCTAVPSFTDGEIRATIEVPATGFTGLAGILARTTNWWSGGNNGFGWFAYITNSGQVGLAYGTNANSTTLTDAVPVVSAGHASGAFIEMIYRFSGSSHKVYTAGTLRINTTNATYQSTAGECGFKHQHGGPNDVSVDDLQVYF